jgi:NADPH:quinone reductase
LRIHRQHAFGGPETLLLEDVPEPECPPDGYLVQVRAIGVNFADIVQRRGRYRPGQSLPQVLGKEAAGVVTARGPGASRHAVGDAVLVLKFDDGCYAETIAAREEQLLAPPPGLDAAEQAAFAACFLTAWYALTEVARVRPGDALLVQAAAGGVGGAAVQLGRALGCAPVIGAAGGAEKCAHVQSLGATACADTQREDFRDVVRRLTGGRGADVCLESVGGDVAQRSLQVLAPLGRMVILGFSSIERDHGARIAPIHPLTLLHRSITVGGLDMDALAAHRRRREWDALLAFVAAHGLRPVVGARFPFERAAEAHAALESRRTIGKVILVLEHAPAPQAALP